MVESCEKALLEKLKAEYVYDDYFGLLFEKDSLKDMSYLTTRGYRRIYVAGQPYLLHRLIFFYHNGFFPKVVDHIDGDLYNNRIENLQGCDQQVNIEKAKIFKTNKTGFKGVSYHKAAGKYESYFWKNYKKIYCGLYDTAEEAHKARLERKYSHNETNNERN
jgi:hypothetical protein